MNNRELYQKAFSTLHTTHTLELEEANMRRKHASGLRCRRSLLVAALLTVALLAMASIGYAATDGAMLDTIKIWINGQSADGAVTQEADGSVSVPIDEHDQIEMVWADGEAIIHAGAMQGKAAITTDGDGDVTAEVVIDKITSQPGAANAPDAADAAGGAGAADTQAEPEDTADTPAEPSDTTGAANTADAPDTADTAGAADTQAEPEDN